MVNNYESLVSLEIPRKFINGMVLINFHFGIINSHGVFTTVNLHINYALRYSC